MEFILFGIIVFCGVKFAQSWDRYAVRQAQRDYDAQVNRIRRLNA